MKEILEKYEKHAWKLFFWKKQRFQIKSRELNLAIYFIYNALFCPFTSRSKYLERDLFLINSEAKQGIGEIYMKIKS